MFSPILSGFPVSRACGAKLLVYIVMLGEPSLRFGPRRSAVCHRYPFGPFRAHFHRPIPLIPLFSTNIWACLSFLELPFGWFYRKKWNSHLNSLTARARNCICVCVCVRAARKEMLRVARSQMGPDAGKDRVEYRTATQFCHISQLIG